MLWCTAAIVLFVSTTARKILLLSGVGSGRILDRVGVSCCMAFCPMITETNMALAQLQLPPANLLPSGRGRQP